MAKCIENFNGVIERLPENNEKDIRKINNLIKNGWNYVSKSKWKSQNPDRVNVQDKPLTNKIKKEKTSKPQQTEVKEVKKEQKVKKK